MRKEYPKYTREENKSCKLTQEQIDEIQELYMPKKFGMRKVAKEVGLPFSTVRYWCLTEEQRHEMNVKKMKYNKKLSKEEVKKYNDDRKKRKGEEFKEYESNLKKEYLKKPGIRDKRRKYMKEYHLKKNSH